MDKESSSMKNMIPTNDRGQGQRFAYFGNSLYPFHFGMSAAVGNGAVRPDASPVNDKRQPDEPASPEPCFRLEYLPEAAEAKLVDYRGQKMAAFVVDGETMICLPQAYEIFLKHLVGGLHTVYTKLKRLEITPFVCNVEQVRALRSIGAIQPGVNRCKLIACRDFDVLYDDCASSNSKPGRPPKRCSLYGQGVFGHETPTHDAKKPKFSSFLQRNARPMKFESDFNGGCGGGSLSAVQAMPSTAPVILGGSSSSGDRTPLQQTAAVAAAGAQPSAPIFPFYNLNAPHHFFMSQLPFMAKQWSDYGMNAFKQCLENYGGQRSPAATTPATAATPDATADAPPQLAVRNAGCGGGAAFPFFASQWNNFSMNADDDKKGEDGCNEGEDGRETETNLESNAQKNDDKESPKSMDSDSSDAAVNLTVNNHHGSSSSSSSACQFSSPLEHIKSTSSPLSSSSLSSSLFGGDNSESQSIQKSSSDNKLSDENGNGGKKCLPASLKSEERQRKSSGQKRQSSKDRMNNNNNINNNSQSSKKTIFPTPMSQIDLSNKNRSSSGYVNFFSDNKNDATGRRSTAAATPSAAGETVAPFSSVQKLLFDVIRLMEMAAVTSQKQEEQFFKDKIELSKAYEEEKREKSRIENLLDEEKRAKTVYQKRWRQTMKKYKTLRERHSAAQTTNNGGCGSGGNSSEETNNDTLKMGADSSSMANEMMEEAAAAAAAAAAATNETLCGGGSVTSGGCGGGNAASRSSGYNSSSIKSPTFSCSSASSLKKDLGCGAGCGSPNNAGRCCESSGNCSSSDSSAAAAANGAGKVQHRVHYRNHHHHHRHHHPYEHIKRSGQFASGAYSSSTTSLSSATSSKASPGSSDEKNCCQKMIRGKNVQTSAENKEKSAAQTKESSNNVVVDFSIRSSGNTSHHTTPIAQEPLQTTKVDVEKMEMN